MPRTFTEADFADAPATGRVFTDEDFAPPEEPSIVAEGLKAIARAGLRIGKAAVGSFVQAPSVEEASASMLKGTPFAVTAQPDTGVDRAKQVAAAFEPAMSTVAEAPGLQDRPWNDPARLASAGGEMLPATAAVIGSAALSGGAVLPAMLGGAMGATEQLQRGNEEGDPNAEVKALGAGAFDAATSFLPFHIIGKIASPALKTAVGAGGMAATNPIVAAARALLTGDDPKAAAMESFKNTPISLVQGAATGRFAPESAAVKGRKIEAGRKAAREAATLEAAADEAVRTAQELNDWDSAWSEAGRLAMEKQRYEQRMAKNATLAAPDQTGSMAPDEAAALRARDTDLALTDRSPEFSDLRLAPESLDANPLGQVDTDNPITPRIYPNEGKMAELPDMVSSPETSAPKAALPDVEAIRDFPTSGPEVGKVGVEPMLPPGRVRGLRRAPTIIPDLPGKPGLLEIDPMTGGPEPPRIGPEGSPVYAPGPPVPEIGGIGGGPDTPAPGPRTSEGGLGQLTSGPEIDPYAGMAGHLTPGGFPAPDPRIQTPPLAGLGGADPLPRPLGTSAGGLGQMSEGPAIAPFEAMRNAKGELTFRKGPVAPQETTSPATAQAPVAPEMAPPAPAAAAVEPIPATEAQPSPVLPPGRKRPMRGKAMNQTPNDALSDWRAGIKSAGVKPSRDLVPDNTGYQPIPGLIRKTAKQSWDQYLQEAEAMGIPVKEHSPAEFMRLLRGKNTELSPGQMDTRYEAHALSLMSQDAQDAAKVYGGIDAAIDHLKSQREQMASKKEDTAAVDGLISELEGDIQSDLFGKGPDPISQEEADSLFGPTAGVVNLTAMRDLPGALLKEGVALAKKAGRKIARGNDPDGLQPIKEDRANVLSSLGWSVQKALGEYDDAVKAEYKRAERPGIELLANEALQGRIDARDSTEARLQSEAAMAKLAPKTRAAVKKARALLDKTSQRLVDEGIGTDATLSTVQGNLGIWAKRSYQVFDDPSHLAAVEASPKWQDWAEQRAVLERQRGNNVTVEEAKGLNKAMLAKMAEEGQGRYLTNTTLGKSDLSSFKQRNEIPLWMREMMGQYADFRVNFTKSAKSNANMIANHGFQEQVNALGAGKFIFDNPTDAAYVQFPASSEYGVLANKFTTPEFRDTLQGIIGAKQNGPIDQLLAATSAVARFNKTAGNFPRGTFRQLPSNLKAGLQAGHVTPGTFLTPAGWNRVAQSGKIAWSALRGRENVNVAQVMDDLYARGVLDSDAIQSLQKESVEDVTGPQSKLGQSRLGHTKAGRKALDLTKKTTDKFSNVYMTFDNLQKANGYLAEMDLYKHKVQSGEWTIEQLKDHAADVVKDVYPTRVRVLSAAEKGRNVPVVADFVFYKSERLRNNVSLLKRIGQEINDPDPNTRMVGWKRAAGLMAGMAGAPALLAAANLKNGVDDDKDKAWRDLAGDRLPWLANTSLAYTSHGSGKAKVMDIGYMDSDQQITDAVRALIEGKDWQASMGASMQQFLGEFVGLNMATNIVTGLVAGVDPETQKPIASKGDEWLQQQLSKVNWAFKKGEPGTLTLARQANEAWKGKRSAAEVALSVAGPATYNLDAKDLLKSSIYEYRDTVMAQRTKVNRAKKVDPASGGSVKSGANENLKVAFRALNEKVKAAGKVGLKRTEIRAILKDAGFSEGDQMKILNNVWNSRELGIK